MSRNKSRNDAVHINSISKTLETLTNQQHSSSRKTKALFLTEFSDSPHDFWPLVYSSLLPVICPNANLCPAMKKFFRCNLGPRSDREIVWVVLT